MRVFIEDEMLVAEHITENGKKYRSCTRIKEGYNREIEIKALANEVRLKIQRDKDDAQIRKNIILREKKKAEEKKFRQKQEAEKKLKKKRKIIIPNATSQMMTNNNYGTLFIDRPAERVKQKKFIESRKEVYLADSSGKYSNPVNPHLKVTPDKSKEAENLEHYIRNTTCSVAISSKNIGKHNYESYRDILDLYFECEYCKKGNKYLIKCKESNKEVYCSSILTATRLAVCIFLKKQNRLNDRTDRRFKQEIEELL